MLDSWRGMGGAMCIAGSKGQDKSPLAWKIRARAQRREHASTPHDRGASRGGHTLASKTRRTKTAAMRRRRARGRESGAGDVRMAGSSDCLSIPIIPFFRKLPFTANGYNSTPKTPDRRIYTDAYGCCIFTTSSFTANS